MKAGVIIGHLNHKSNESALLRTAEAFNVNNVFVVGKKEKLYVISQGADHHMVFNTFKTNNELINYLKKNNHHIVCVEYTPKAVSLNKAVYPCNPVFVPGNEGQGIPKEIMNNADLIVKIKQAPTYMRCLNTTIASAIVIHDWYNKMKDKDRNQYYES